MSPCRTKNKTHKRVDELYLEPTAIVQISFADISGRKPKEIRNRAHKASTSYLRCCMRARKTCNLMLQNKLMLLVLPSSFKLVGQTTNQIVVPCHFFLPENNRLKIMVYSCSMSSNCVWLQIIFCSRLKETMLKDIH